MNSHKTNFRWVVVAMMFLVTLINYLDRSSIAYAAEIIAAEFHFSQSAMGILLGAFGIGYSIFTFFGGLAADHFGAKRTLLISTAVWSVSTLLFGLASGFGVFVFARILLGCAEGPNFPGVTRAVSDWLPENERTRAFSFALLSVPFSLAISGPVIVWLISYFSWRGSFFILTTLGVIWLPFWWWLFRDKPCDSPYVNTEEQRYIQHVDLPLSQVNETKTNWKILLKNKTLLTNYYGFFVFGFYLFFFMNWLPTYLSTTYHITLSKVGFYTAFPWLMAMILMFISSSIADKIFKRTRNLRLSRTYPILISQILSALSVMPLIQIQSLNVAMISISLAVGFAMSSNASFYAVNVDIAKDRAATALGIMDSLFAVAGFIAPTLTGFVVTFSGHYHSVFLLLTVLGLSSFTLTWFFHNQEKG